MNPIDHRPSERATVARLLTRDLHHADASPQIRPSTSGQHLLRASTTMQAASPTPRAEEAAQ